MRSYYSESRKAKESCDAQIETLRNDHANQIAEINRELQTQILTAQQLNSQISALEGSGTSDQSTIASLQQSLTDAQSEITELQIAKTECEGKIAQLEEPLVLETSAFTSGTSPNVLNLNIGERERIVAEIAKRDELIKRLRDAQPRTTRQTKIWKLRAKTLKPQMMRLKTICHGLGVIAVIAIRYAAHKSGSLK